MKKLSRELIKSHILLIAMFISVLITTYIYSAYSLFKQSKIDIRGVEEFLIEELSKPQHQDIDVFFHNVIIESPKTEDLFIILSYKEKTLKTHDSPNLKELPFTEKIQEVGFYDYYIIKNNLITTFGKNIDFTIIRGLQEEKTFLFKKLKIYFFGSLLIIAVGFIISSYFYKKVIPQLSKLEDITNKVNLHSFHSDIKKEELFSEFYTIVASYENMLVRLEKQAASQIDFINNASHELRTPIFVIGGYVNLIKRWGIDDKEISKEAFDYIQSEVSGMGILIEKLLFLAKQDKIESFHEEVHLKELIKEIIKEMNILYPKQTFNLTLAPVTIISDSSLLKQLIRNLLSNAIKYGGDNSIDIILEYSSKISLTITDRGIGMSEEDLSRSFEKFFRGDKSRERKSHGHGLGLPIVKQILNILKGNIIIKSVKDKGTTVKVYLPTSPK